MLRIITILGLVGVLGAEVGAAQSWEVLENAPEANNSRHEDIVFVTPEVGWIVGGSGIYKTVSGGRGWFQQSPGIVFFRSAGFVSEEVGWVGSLTPGQVLFETRDGGRTWTDITRRIEGAVPTGICGLWVVDENTIYGVGIWAGPARLIKTTDGGQTWRGYNLSARAGTLVDVFFFDANRGFAVGGTSEDLAATHALILVTDDGGATWRRRYTSSDAGEWGWKISFPTPEVGYVSVESDHRAKVLKTTDGGLTWTEHVVPRGRGLQGVGFVSERLGWVGGRTPTRITTDGGVTWTETPFGRRLNRFRMLGDTLGFAVGERAYVYRATPTARAEAPAPPAFRLGPAYPNPAAGSATLAYTLHQPGRVRLTLHDVRGRRLRHLVDAYQAAGPHTIAWDGTDAAGRRLAPGVYFYRLTAAGQSQTRAVLRMR